MKALVMNVESVKRSEEAEDLIKQYNPGLVYILQAYRARRWLRKYAKAHGYRHYQYFGPEAKSIATLIKKDGVKVIKRDYLQMDQKWKGPKQGRWHLPRRFPWFILEKGGEVTRTIGVHFPTRNEPDAQAEALNTLERFVRHHPNSTIAAMGDFNLKEPAMKKIAKDMGAALHTVGSVDHGLFWAGNGRHLETGSKSLRRWMQEGAHGWGMYWWRSKVMR